MNVDLADDVTFSNHPDETSDGGWLQVLHSFPQPIFVTAGEHLDLMVGHDRNSLIVVPPPDLADRRINTASIRAGGRRTG
jgi:type II protein arginine methyltransferase